MRIVCRPNLWDYREAFRLHHNRTPNNRLKFLLLYRIIPVFSVAGLILLNAYDVKVQLQTAGILLSLLITVLWIGILLALVPSHEVRRNQKRSPASNEVVFEIDDEKVIAEIPNYSQTKMPWSAFVDFAKNEKVAILYYTKDCFFLIPSEKLTPVEKAQLYSVIDRNLTRKSC